jgi:hypothetical protein
MIAPSNIDEYLEELRTRVCARCVVRREGAPPCRPLGVLCGIEQHWPQLVHICRTVDSSLLDPYANALATEICSNCKFRDRPVCPCPLKYLLPLAIDAVEAVDHRRSAARGSAARG